MAVDPLERLYNDYSRMVFRVCSRYAGTRHEAEDLTQETLLQAHDSLRAFRGECGESTWIYRIAINKCLEHLRMMKRRNELDRIYLDGLVAGNITSGGDQVLARIDLDKILSRVLPRTRKILFLCLAEGLSYTEAGEVLGMEKSAVAKTVLRFKAEISRRGSAAGVKEAKGVPVAQSAARRGDRND